MVIVSRETKQAEFETYLRRMMKRFNKEVQEDTHKVCVCMTGIICLVLHLHVMIILLT